MYMIDFDWSILCTNNIQEIEYTEPMLNTNKPQINKSFIVSSI